MMDFVLLEGKTYNILIDIKYYKKYIIFALKV